MTRLKQPETWILLGILSAALGLRVWNLSAGVPFGVEIDEPVIVDRALNILSSGSWNPQGFDYPSLVIYFHTCVAAVRFVWGASQGQWKSLRDFDISAVYSMARFATALLGVIAVWLTYRLGRALSSHGLGLIAAAQLAVNPMHVRESHFALTDVPATTLVTATLWLSVRAGQRRTVGAYAWAGCMAGLAAAAKYNAGVVVVAVGLAWILNEHSADDRWTKAAAAVGASIATFVVTVPYAVLALPAFLNGFGGQLARFSPQNAPPGLEPMWRIYLTYLSQSFGPWIPIATVGLLLVFWRRHALRSWMVPVGFLVAYGYVLAVHSVAFGRYALPLLPGLSLLASVPIIELGQLTSRRAARPALRAVVLAVGSLMVTASFASDTVVWLDAFRKPDTRVLAGRWLSATLPRESKLVVESSGPTNLSHTGFNVIDQPNLIADDALEESLKAGLSYVIVARWSTAGLPKDSRILSAGRTVFSADPSAARWGPAVRVVQVVR